MLVLMKRSYIVILLLAQISYLNAEAPLIWSDECGNISLWQAKPKWVGNVAKEYSLKELNGKLIFKVSGRAMKYARNWNKPVPISAGNYIAIKYMAKGIGNDTDYLFSFFNKDASRSQKILKASDIQIDGQWKTLVRRVDKNMRVSGIALQINGNGEFILDWIRIYDHRPPIEIEQPELKKDVLKRNKFANQEIKCINFNASKGNYKTFLYHDVPLQVVESPIVVNKRDCTTKYPALNIIHTGEQLILFSDIKMSGNDSYSSGGGGLLWRVKNPSEFLCKLNYSDGSTVLAMPYDITRQCYGLTVGLGIYAFDLDPELELKSVTFINNRNGLTLKLLAATLLKKKQFLIPQPKVWPAEFNSKELSELAPKWNDNFELIGKNFILKLHPKTGKILEYHHKDWPGLKLKSNQWISICDRDHKYNLNTTNVKFHSGRVVIDFKGEDIKGKVFLSPRPYDGINISAEITSTNAANKMLDVSLGECIFLVGNVSGTWLFYPARSMQMANDNVLFEEALSGRMSIPMMGMFTDLHDQGVCFVGTDHQNNCFQYLHAQKQKDKFNFSFKYPYLNLQEKRPLKIPGFSIFAHHGKWKTQIEIFKKSLQSWYNHVPRKQWFQNVFSFRQQYMRSFTTEETLLEEETGRYQFEEIIEKDRQFFGQIDMLHIFDWGTTSPIGGYDFKRFSHKANKRMDGRCGDYTPYSEIGGREKFYQQIQKIQNTNLPVGLYLEGWLVSNKSRLARKARHWEAVNIEGKHYPYYAWQDVMNMCSSCVAWQKELARIVKRVLMETGAKAIYIDEFGFCETPNRFCWNLAHGHQLPGIPLRGETRTIKLIRKTIGNKPVIYTEETSSIVVTQYQDGSFTHIVGTAGANFMPSLSPLRVILPKYKLIEILATDKPLGHARELLSQVLFQGLALHLQGSNEKSEKFPPDTLQFLRNILDCYAKARNAFAGNSVEFLCKSKRPEILINRFQGTDQTAWTFYNVSYCEITDFIMEIPWHDRVVFKSLIKDVVIEAKKTGKNVRITAKIPPRSVGCLLMEKISN